MKRGCDDNIPHVPKTPKLSREKTSSNSSLNTDAVNVFCRLRPLHEDPEISCIKILSPTTISITTENKNQRRDSSYVFKHIFSSYSSQREIFEHVALPLLENVINGKNGLLFTYGVTGSGKTFTLTGDQNNPGVMPRCIDTLFNTIGEFQTPKFQIKPDKLNGFEVQNEGDALEDQLQSLRTNKRTRNVKPSHSQEFYINDGARIQNFSTESRYAVFISYTEIYNNTVFDLLDETAGKVLQAKIIRVDANKNMYVNGVVEVEVKSAEETFELFYLGQKRKRMAHTVLNAESSRSHSIFNIRVVQTAENVLNRGVVSDETYIKVGQLSLVDLAGSERCSRTQNTGIRLKEASSINNSLMSLRSCLEILRENQLTGGNRLVPYRDSRLTMLFKNYFDGEGQVRMIVCINPSVQDLEENLQVMKFAEMSRDVKIPKSEAKFTLYTKTPKSVKSSRITKTPKITKIRKPLFPVEIEFLQIRFIQNDIEENDPACAKLLQILKTRRYESEEYKKEVDKCTNDFRKHLLQVQDENVLGKSEILSMKAVLRKHQQANKNLETKMMSLELAKNDVLLKNKDLEFKIRNMESTIEAKNLKINQNALEKEKTKQKVAVQTAKMTQELDDKLRRQREHLKVTMQNQEAKIKKVQEILDSESVVYSETPRTEPKKPKETYESRSAQFTDFTNTPRRNAPPRPNRHRRSRSAGEVYLEHNAVKPVALGTVLQPCMKKRKSVTKLDKAKDVTNPNQNRYCLIAQESNVEGGVETKLYKGDILSTCSGGAQVIFSDVERLKQESPTGSPLITDFK